MKVEAILKKLMGLFTRKANAAGSPQAKSPGAAGKARPGGSGRDQARRARDTAKLARKAAQVTRKMGR